MGTYRLAGRARRLPLAIGALLALGACGSNNDPSPGANQTQPAAQAKPSAPPTLEAQLKGVGSRTPKAAVLTLYYYAKWGGYPRIVQRYHPRVRKVITNDAIAAVYSLNREAFIAWTPRVVDVQHASEGTLVAVELRRQDGDPSYESFLLRKRGGTWAILYDTYFDRALGDYVRATIEGPASQRPTKRGAEAAGNASRGFRGLFLRDAND